MGKIFCISLPIKIESEGNNHDHYMQRYRRLKKQTRAIKWGLVTCDIKPPCRVRLTRVAPRALDKVDNLRTAMKHVIDAVASHMLPHLKAGRADGCKDIEWQIDQVKDKPKEYGLRIEIEQYENDYSKLRGSH
jgi:hypothetical protein